MQCWSRVVLLQVLDVEHCWDTHWDTVSDALNLSPDAGRKVDQHAPVAAASPLGADRKDPHLDFDREDFHPHALVPISLGLKPDAGFEQGIPLVVHGQEEVAQKLLFHFLCSWSVLHLAEVRAAHLWTHHGVVHHQLEDQRRHQIQLPGV